MDWLSQSSTTSATLRTRSIRWHPCRDDVILTLPRSRAIIKIGVNRSKLRSLNITVRQKMKKALIGSCPKCGTRVEISLSPWIESPVGSPWECHACRTPLAIAPEHPRLAAIARILLLAIVCSGYLFGMPVGALGFVILGYFLFSSLIDRTLGRSTLVIPSPRSDFLCDELSTKDRSARSARNEGEQAGAGRP